MRTSNCAVLAAALLAAAPAVAQLKDCPAIARDPAAYKVVLGEVAAPGEASRERDAIRSQLRFKLRTSAEALQLAEEQRQLRPAVCDGRLPSDESEFSGAVLENLSQLGVVLEVWGEVRPTAAGTREGQLNFAVISLLRFEPKQAGFFDIRFAAPAGAASNVVLKDNVEFEALATLALAVRYRRDRRYEAGARAFCEAQTHLARSAQQADAASAARWSALRDFAIASRASMLKEALAEPTHGAGVELIAARGCAS